ncbi:MAG: pyrimidine dimer DNA glycosylase/endonuclease V [Nitrospirota bacterium]
MRLWTLHPRYLDRKGLVALWREGLLAQKVLLGETKGYRNHPQLERFRVTSAPVGSIAAYLKEVYEESLRRGFRFDKNKINRKRTKKKINVTRGQVDFEIEHLKRKIKSRDKEKYKEIKMIKKMDVNPLFIVKAGDIESWEKSNKT